MDKPYLIVMSGLPGSGKSTIAEGIAQQLRITLLSVDPIESAVVKSGIAKSFETGLAAYLVAEALAAEQLKLGNSVIVDAVNAEEEGKNIWRALAKRLDLAPIIIEVTLSDSELHRKRVESHTRNLHGMSEVTWDRVEARRKAYTPWREPHLQLDALNPLNDNVAKAIRYINDQ